MSDLETVLADWHERVTELRRLHAHVTPDTLGQCLADIERAGERYLRWVSEPDAQLYSGRRQRWLRDRYHRLEAEGDARRVGGKRYYRLSALPVRPSRDRIAGEAARDAAADSAAGTAA